MADCWKGVPKTPQQPIEGAAATTVRIARASSAYVLAHRAGSHPTVRREGLPPDEQAPR